MGANRLYPDPVQGAVAAQTQPVGNCCSISVLIDFTQHQVLHRYEGLAKRLQYNSKNLIKCLAVLYKFIIFTL